MVSKEQICNRKMPGASTFELQLELGAGLLWNCHKFAPPEDSQETRDGGLPLLTNRRDIFRHGFIEGFCFKKLPNLFSLFNYFGSALAPTIWALFSFGSSKG